MNSLVEALSSTPFLANFFVVGKVIFGLLALGGIIAGAFFLTTAVWKVLEENVNETAAWLSSAVLVAFFATLFMTALITFAPPA